MDVYWFIILLLTFAVHIGTKHLLHKFTKLPPTLMPNLPFLGHLYLLRKPLYRTLAKISNRYGPILLLQFGSRRILLVSSPSAVEECFTGENDLVFANRPRLLAGKLMGYNYSTLTWSSYGKHWRNLRRISRYELLSTQSLEMLHDVRFDEVKSMIRLLNNNAASKEYKVFDVKKLFFELTMNVSMRMIAGKRYYGENVDEVEEAKQFREIAHETLKLTGSHLGDFLPLVNWLGVGGLERKMTKLQNRKDEFMQMMLEECKTKIERKKSRDHSMMGENTKTLVEIMLDLQDKDPHYYTDKLIRSFMLTLLVGATDTSAGTMEWALSLLLINPRVLKKAQNEIDDRVGRDRLIEESDLTNLSYLRCVVYETLRMYPPGPLIPHESSEQCTVGGYRIPARTMLLANVWSIHNDPKNWEDPTSFKPERFLGLERSHFGFKFIPFSSGRRGCPGEGLAMRMLGLALGSIIQCFDWEYAGDGPIDMAEGSGLTMPKREPLMAKCKARSTATKILSQL